MIRRHKVFPVEEVLLAQFVPGFLFAMGWTAMYEIYHEEGSYFTTLLQEILGSEDLFPYFLVLAVLMSFPLGMIVDAVRYVVGEVWLGLPRTASGNPRPSLLPEWLERLGGPVEEIELRYSLYRHARAALLTPARTAGNLALVALIFTVWSAVKIFRMGGVQVFSLAFVIGAPLAGLGLSFVLLVRYATGLDEFQREVHGPSGTCKEPVPPARAAETSGFPSDPRILPDRPQAPERS